MKVTIYIEPKTSRLYDEFYRQTFQCRLLNLLLFATVGGSQLNNALAGRICPVFLSDSVNNNKTFSKNDPFAIVALANNGAQRYANNKNLSTSDKQNRFLICAILDRRSSEPKPKT